MVNVPASERGKLFPFVPESIIPAIAITVVVLGILLFESLGVSKTNPVIFYSVPFLYLLLTLTVSNVPIIISTLGLGLRDTRERIIVLLSLPIGGIIGWGLARLAVARVAIFRVATYPWVSQTLSTAGQLSVFGSTETVVLYFFVAFFEEGTSIFLGKNIGNFIWKRTEQNKTAGIIASIGGYTLARLVLVTHHWFAYRGFQQPLLYVSATLFFIIFTVLALVTGLIIHKFRTGDDFDELGFLPISMLVAVMAHWVFDITMSILLT